jgi:hypothetical protein
MEITIASKVTSAVRSVAGAESIMIFPYGCHSTTLEAGSLGL